MDKKDEEDWHNWKNFRSHDSRRGKRVILFMKKNEEKLNAILF